LGNDLETAAKTTPVSADLHRTTTRLKKIAGVLLPIVALFILAVWFKQSVQRPTAMQPIGFYPVEANNQIDYSFAHPHAGLLLERPTVPAELTFRVFSPEPLPRRSLIVGYDQHRINLPAMGAEPRIVHVALPTAQPEAPHGLLIELETTGARAPGDQRDLGLLFDYIDIQMFAGSQTPWGLLAALALLLGSYLLLISSREGLLFAGVVLLLLVGLLLIDQRLCLLGLGLLTAHWLWVKVRRHRSLSDWTGQTIAMFAQPASRYPILVVAVALVYSALVSFYSIATYSSFRADTYDLGNFDQTLWLISRFIYPYNTGMGVHFMGDHASFLLYPLAALYWLAADVRLLLAIQSIVVALGVVPLYLIAKQHQQPLIGCVVAVAYLLHPATSNMNLFDFHPDALAATALLFAIWGIERRRWWIVGIACLVILGVKENFAITVGLLGVWMICRRMWRFGGVLLVVSVGWFFLATRLIVPPLNGQPETLFFSRFSQYGNNLPDIATFALFHPQIIIADLLQPSKVSYLWQLLLPFALLPLLSPRYLVLAAPALFLNMLSNFSQQQTLIFHYNALIVPVAAVASIKALVWLIERVSYQRFIVVGSAILIICCTAYALTASYSRFSQYYDRSDKDEARISLYNNIVSLVPSEANISAQSNFQPHLTHRIQAFVFPNPFQRAAFFNPADLPFTPRIDYIVYDTRRPNNFYAPAKAKLRLLADLQSRGLYRPLVELDGIVVLQRADAMLDERCFGMGWDAPQCRAK
jgi:uncharacterized membrane protein